MNKVLEQFRDQVNHFLDDLITICPTEQDFVQARLYFSVITDVEPTMASFIRWVYPWKEQILKRDAAFFRDNEHPFGSLPSEHVSKFRNLYFSDTLSVEEKKIIWDYFSIFIKLMEKYQKVR